MNSKENLLMTDRWLNVLKNLQNIQEIDFSVNHNFDRLLKSA
jgi:hypothetical protein